MPATREPPVLTTATHWYCVRTQPKRENLAFGQLGTLPEVEPFFPRVRYRKTVKRGARSVTEALFPNYVFARFSPARSARAVKYARGAAYIVRQGRDLAPVHDAIIAELRALTANEVLDLPPEPWQLGENVRVIAGIFRGASGKIVGLVPARQRVQILLELLGRENRIEIPFESVETRPVHPFRALTP